VITGWHDSGVIELLEYTDYIVEVGKSGYLHSYTRDKFSSILPNNYTQKDAARLLDNEFVIVCHKNAVKKYFRNDETGKNVFESYRNAITNLSPLFNIIKDVDFENPRNSITKTIKENKLYL
jgi:type I restriction-modification system DNA methylase subunit